MGRSTAATPRLSNAARPCRASMGSALQIRTPERGTGKAGPGTVRRRPEVALTEASDSKPISFQGALPRRMSPAGLRETPPLLDRWGGVLVSAQRKKAPERVPGLAVLDRNTLVFDKTGLAQTFLECR